VSQSLTSEELIELTGRVFRPRPEDRALALLVDLPDSQVADDPGWADRRELIHQWKHMLDSGREKLGLEEVRLVLYRNVRRNNADLPVEAWVHAGGDLPGDADEVEGPSTSFDELFSSHTLVIAASEFSATAPLKLQARKYGFRAASMPGFTRSMIPALRLDYEEVDRRCRDLKAKLDDAHTAILRFEAGGAEQVLSLDLRHRQATASGGLLREPGTAGNLPSGETYIVPYEGELPGDPSRSEGTLPIQLEGELMVYRIAGNRIVGVLGDGPKAEEERREVAVEPAYANVAELGLGLLGLHVAFGRSDHFGGQVGAADFTSPDRVVHIDRVYIPEVQPAIHVRAVDLEGDRGSVPLMRDGTYV